PRPLRRLNPAVPLDLETIVAKAMDKEPAGRYATASELAEDLRRFLAHEPIRARRPSLLDRAAKWSRRHRGMAAAALAALVLVAVGLAVGAVLIARERDAAVRAGRLAEARFDQARAIVDRMYTQTVDDLDGIPKANPVRRALLEDELEFYR